MRVAVLAAALLAAGAALAAEGPLGETSPGASAKSQGPEEGTRETTAEAEAGVGEEAGAVDPCAVPRPEGEAWIDRMRRQVFERACGTALWFDGFFGDIRFDEETRPTYGRMSLDLWGDERGDFDARFRFRAKLSLPNLDERFEAFFGRDDEEKLVADRGLGFEDPTGFLGEDEDQALLAGLGYSPVRSARRRLQLNGGIKVRFPLEPFVQVRYRRHHLVGRKQLLRWRETVFWTSQQGFGSTTSIDLDTAVGTRSMLRWGSRGTISEATSGLEWRSGVTLFQGLGAGRAMAWVADLEGTTDEPVDVERYGVRIIFRRRVFRDWLFGEIAGGLSWPKDRPEQAREPVWGLGFGVEMLFGETR